MPDLGSNVILGIAVGTGAAVGAIARWQLSLLLNVEGAAVSLGTLSANALGAFVVGIALVLFSLRADLSPIYKLWIVTGFCGGLTTFSTFSAEVFSLLLAERFGAAMFSVLCHVSVSLLSTFIGWQVGRFWVARFPFIPS